MMPNPYPQTPKAAEDALAAELPGRKRPVIVIAIDEQGKHHPFVGSDVTQDNDPDNNPPKRFTPGGTHQLTTMRGERNPTCIYYVIGGQLRMFCW